MSAEVPGLESYCGSWIVSLPSGAVCGEFYDRGNVERLATAGYYTIETAAQYLGRLNRRHNNAND